MLVKLKKNLFMFHVELHLTRANKIDNAFHVWNSIPEHCADAAITLFLADTLKLYDKISDTTIQCLEELRTNFDVRKDAKTKLELLVLTAKKIMQKKLSGSLSLSLRNAAFITLLRYKNFEKHESQHNGVLEWAERNRLRGHVRELKWCLSDVMLALETLALHWEPFCQSVWESHSSSVAVRSFQDNTDSEPNLQSYLNFLWQQCGKFIFFKKNNKTNLQSMDAGVFTLPYVCESNGEHEIALHMDAITEMCELWRWMTYEISLPFLVDEISNWSNDDAENETQFLSLFQFEKKQLDVDKFREDLRKRIVSRYLAPGDVHIYASLTGKDPEPDAVMGKRGCLNVPGFVQQVASAWTFEKLVKVPQIRDELYRAMADSGCRSKVGTDFSTKFYRPPGPPLFEQPPNIQVPYIKRYMHAHVIVYKGKGVSPPLNFASAFASWARLIRYMNMQPYGVNFIPITNAFA